MWAQTTPAQRSDVSSQTRAGRVSRGTSPVAAAATSSGPEIYETPRRSVEADTEGDTDDDDDDDAAVEEHVRRYGRTHFGEIASPYLTPYLYNRRFLDKVFGIRKDEGVDGPFMIGNSSVEVDDSSNVTIQGKQYRGTRGLWELLTRKKVNQSLITTQDLKTYKRILELTSGHLENHDPAGTIKTTRGTKFKEVISKLFPQSRRRRRGVETGLRRTWVTY
jgi:hypothetical protein